MIVSIGGVPGAGKTTLAKFLHTELGVPRYYMGAIFRKLADEKGVTLNEFFAIAKNNPEIDNEIDEYQRKLGVTEESFVIEGRTSFYFIPHSFKIYLTCDLQESARRIKADCEINADRHEHYASLEESQKKLQERMALESEQYKRIYGVDIHDPHQFDLVLDTTNMSEQEVQERILAEIKLRQQQ